MSRESIEWLNNNVLVGFTERRGNAWHYQASQQGVESNHYAGAVPVADVERRLFHWTPVVVPLSANLLTDEGVSTITDASYQVLVRPDTQQVLGVHSDGYAAHDYRSTLLTGIEQILDDDLGIGSAGLLRGGARAWVSVEVPENIDTPQGVTFRPNLLAATSLDGSLATIYKRVITNVVCDNTLAAALSEDSGSYKIKHTAHSVLRVADARAALDIVYGTADDFAAQIADLCATSVSEKQWGAFLDAHYGEVPTEEGRGRTIAINRQDSLRTLYARDERVAPWSGTAWGVLQAANTYLLHEQTVRNRSREERNRELALNGGIEKHDVAVLGTLTRVLANV